MNVGVERGRYVTAFSELPVSERPAELRQLLVDLGDVIEQTDLERPLWKAIDILDGLSAERSAEDARNASAGQGFFCADCTMDNHACPECYMAWWKKKHPDATYKPYYDVQVK